MRNWRGAPPPKDIDPRVYEILKRLIRDSDQSQAAFAKLDRGTQTNASQTSVVVSVTDHGGLSGLSDDDHPQYLLMGGTRGAQTLVGGLEIDSPYLTTSNLVLKRIVSQTAPFLQAKDESGTQLSYIRASDGAFVGPVVASGGPFLSLVGALNGQVIGVGSHTGGGTYDVAVEGEILAGNNIGTSPFGPASLQLLHLISTHGSTGNIQGAQSIVLDNSASGAPGTDAIAALYITIPSTFGVNYTSGGFVLSGLNVALGPTLAAGTSGNNIQGILFGLNLAGAGNYGAVTAGDFTTKGSPTAHTGGTLAGIIARVHPGAGTIGTLIGVQAAGQAGTYAGATTQATAFDIGPTFGNHASIVTWSGLRLASGISAAIANKWALDLTLAATNMGSRVAHPVAIGWSPATVAAVTARLMLAAGAAAASKAPLKFQAGTNLTTPETGAVEFDGVDYFITGADRSRIAPRLLSRTAGIALNTVAGTLLYTVPTGRSLIVTDVVLYTTAYTGGAASTFDVGGVAAGDIVTGRNDVFGAANEYQKLPINAAAVVQPATTQIIFNVTAGNRTATVTADLIGYLI